MKKKLTLLVTLVVALCTNSAWAQSVISVGANLDFSEGTPVDNGICTYEKDIVANNTTYSQMLEVLGWTIEGENGDARAAGLFAYGSGHWLGGTGYNVPATNSAGVAEGNALGILAVWSATVQYTQAVTLEAGDYVISVAVYNTVGGTTAPAKSLIGFIADNGTEYLAPAKAYAIDAWTVENIKFRLTEATTGKLSLGYVAPNTGSGGNQHLFFDKVEIMAVTETDLARIDLNAALVSAQSAVNAKANVGAGLFMYSEEAYNAYAAAVEDAKAVSENAEATKDELVAALAALNAATEAYAVTVPASDAVYAVKFNGTENYLTIGESTITIDAAVDALSFEAVGNGKYYIHDNEGKYLSYAGNNKWTMTASADVKDEWTVSANAEGLYTLAGKNGGLGVDGTGAGATCYGDKNGSAMALWAIAEMVIEDEPGNEGGDDVVVAEGNLVENAGFEKWEGDNPANWAGVGHNATIKQSADAKSGYYAVEVAGASANKRLASQTYTLKAGTYKYSVNVKQIGDAAGMCRLGYVSVVDGTYVYLTDPTSVSAEWSEVSCEFTLEAATEIALIVMNSKNGKGASILVDDVVLTTNNGGNEGGDDEGEEEQKPISATIAEIVAAGVQASASTSGTVVATYARGFLIGDGTGYVLTYLGKDSGLAVGDVVTVAGATSMYGGLLQFGNTSTFEKTGTATFIQPNPEVLDGAAMDAYLAVPVIKYVQYTGTLAISGNYYNVTVDGAQKAVGSIQYAPEGLVDAALNGKKIVVTGYFIGVSSSKYVNTMGVSVVAAEEEPAVKTDYTDAIVNADLSTADAWNTEGTKGIANGYVKVGSGSIFDFSQTITLPAGQYKMTAKAAYRYGGDGQTEYDAIQAGTETHLAKLYAATATYKYEGNVMNRYEGASETDLTGGTYKTDVVNNLYVPNASDAVKVWFDKDQYVNELVFNVQEDGEVKIGIANAATSPVGDYTNIGAWTLTRLGDAEADPEIEEPTDPEPDPEEPEETIDMDLTHLVGTSKEAWNATGGPVNIDGISMPENFQDDSSITGVVLWQDVTGLENGKYTVELWANARVAWRESAATDGQEELTYLVANNVEISMQVLLNPGLNNNATYVLEGVEVTDGTLHIEMNKKAAGSNWHTIQIKSLIYHAPANAALDMAKADLKAALDAAAAVPATEALTAAIAAAQAIYDGSDLEAIRAAVAPLQAATKLAILGNASVENPVLTDFVVNGTFDTTIAPWKTTTNAQNKALASNQTGAFTGNFFENWNPSNYTGKIYQVIENIPNGLYELSICAFVNNFDASAQYVYANADKKALVAGEPTAYTVRTTVTDNRIEVGFEQIVAVANWIGIDNVSLTYFGEVSDNSVADNFLAAYAQLELLTESCPTLWMITACQEKFMAIQEPAYAIKEAIDTTPADTLVKYTAVLNETVAFIQTMDVKYNEWKALLFVAYDYQDNSTAEDSVRAAFDEVVSKHQMYQWSMPAASVDELQTLIDELDAARILYAKNATPSDGFDFGVEDDDVTVESPWVGTAVANGLDAYLYNTAAKAFMGAGNSWGTQASFNDGIEWLVEGADELYTLSGPISNGGASHFFTGTYTDGTATQVTVKPVGENIYTLQVGGMYVAYDGTTIVANVAELSEACYWQFVTKAERQSKYATASVANPVDATFEISGADFGRNDGRNSVWTGSPVVGGDNANCCGEKWNAGIATVSQVLRGMPNGVYRMSAQGFYRMGNMGPAAEARTNGTEVLHSKFFANSDSVTIMSVMEEAGKVEGVGANYEGFGLAPNTMGEASKFFSAGLYEHSFVFELAEGVDTIALGVTKTGSVAADWLIFDNFRLEYLGALNESDYFGNGMLTSVAEGNHYVFYTDAEGKNHFLHAAGVNNWVVGDYPTTIAFSAGNITDGFAGAASFMNSNGFYMSNAANADGSGAIKTEEVDGKNGQSKRTWESQVFYKNAAGKYAIRLTNVASSNWGANCFVNIDPATLAVVSGQPSLADALYLWEIADEDDPRFSTQVLDGLIEEAEAIDGKFHRDIKMMLDSVIYLARFATAAEVQAVKVQLEEAIAAAKASVAEYEAIARQLASCASVMVEAAEGYKEFAAVVTSVETAYNNATATAELIPVLVEATSAYLAANEVEGIIVNGDFTNGTAGWTGSMNTGSHNKWTNVNDGFVERWIGNTGLPDIDFYQEISGLPAGTYTFAAYVVACRQSEPDDYEVTGVDLYANGESVAVHTINVDRSVANQAIGAEWVQVTTTIAEGETLRIGMRVVSTDANWVVMDNAKLYSFGAKVEITPGTPDVPDTSEGHLKKGDTFEYTTAEGVVKTYKVVGVNLITNPSFENGTEGWTGGAGGALTGVDWYTSGGVDGGAYLRLTENAGKGGNGSIGTAWALEKGKTYVFSYYIRQNTSTDAVAKEGYIVTSETNTPRGDETKAIMFAHEDANCAWTQNIVVTTAEYNYLQFCARWLGGSKCFDDFVLAEVEEVTLTDAVDNFIAAYESLELLTETCSSLWMIPASNEKFFEVYEPAYAIREAVEETPAETLVEYTALINEAIAFITAMDVKYNEWKEVLWACYDCQDNYTASPEATEAFAVMVDMHSSYQWSMPATTPAEIDGLIAELLAAMDAFLTDAPVSPKMGDVNSDGQHTMSDVVMMVNAVLNIAQNNFNAAVADINGDGQLTIVDVVSVVRFVLGYEPVAAARDMHREASMVAIEAGSLMAGNHGEILLPIYMASDADYTAFQMDVVLPEGLTLADATLGGRGKSSHTLSWSTLDNGATRIVAFAMDNAAFKDNAEALAILTLKAEGALQEGAVINLTDGLFATASGAEDRAADVALKVEDETTGVGTLLGGIRVSGAEGAVVVESAADAVLSIYTMAGQLVQQAEVKAGKSLIALPAGVYVVNNQKVIVK